MNRLHLLSQRLPPELLERIESVCGDFERALKAGQDPVIEDALPGFDGTEREVLLFELLVLELGYRSDQQRDISRDEYRRRFPDQQAVTEAFERFPAAIDLATAMQRIVASGIMDEGELKSVMEGPDATRRPGSAAELFSLLRRRRSLTRFQIDAVRRNFGSLLTLGDYVIVDRLGVGGMGAVYKARHRKLNREVAIKTLRSSMMKFPGAAERFRREIQALARLQHPNILTAYDVLERKGAQYLITEFIAGTDLERLARQSGPMNCRAVVDYALQAAEGLRYAHSQGIVHRDVKPSNLLVDGNGTLKILDMGLARAEQNLERDGSPDVIELTQTGQIFGTLDYISPEQARDTRSADAQSDVYSLGCTLFRLIAGRVPYPAESEVDKLIAHRLRPVPSLRQIRPDVPENLDAIVRRMMAKLKEDRYDSMQDIVHLLSLLRNAPHEELNQSVHVAAPARSAVSADEAAESTVGLRETGPIAARSNRAWVVAIAAVAVVGFIIAFRTRYSSIPEVPRVPPELSKNSAVASEPGSDVLAASVVPNALPISPQPIARQFDDSDLKYFVEAAPKWREVDAKRAAQRAEARVKALGTTEGRDFQVDDLFSRVAALGTDPYQLPAYLRGGRELPVRPGSVDGIALAVALTQSAQEVEDGGRGRFIIGDLRRDDVERFAESFVSEFGRRYQSVGGVGFRNTHPLQMTEFANELTTALRARVDDSISASDAQAWLSDWLRKKASTYRMQLPDSFRLYGQLKAVRVLNQSTWVFLQPPGGLELHETANRGMYGSHPELSAPGVAIEFSNENLGDWMADYKAGDTVRAVVTRDPSDDVRVSAQLPFDRDASFGIPGFNSRQPMPLQLLERLDDCRSFRTAGGSYVAYLVYRGVGIEKLRKPNTWIDSKLGRAAELANPADEQTWLQSLYRNLPKYEGAKGIVRGTYQGTTSKRGHLVVELAVSDASEGVFTVFADLGGYAQPNELLDYRKGDELLAAIRIGKPASDYLPLEMRQFARFSPVPPQIVTPRGRSTGDLDPLSAWMGVEADCTRINKASDQSSLVASTGPRRTPPPMQALSPTDVQTNPLATLGFEVEWTGKLVELVQRDDECHLLVRCDGSPSNLVEAYADDANFIRTLADYVAEREDEERADAVGIVGTVTDKKPRYRIRNSTPLLELRQVWRLKEPNSRALVGDSSPIVAADKRGEVANLAAIWRDPPAVDQRVDFRAMFDYFAEYDQEMRVTSGEDSSIRACVRLSRADDINIVKSLRNNQWVIVKGVVAKQPDGYQITFNADSITVEE